MRDQITITLPREHDLYPVLHLVVGGLAARLDLTLEHLEDLQIALDGLLPHGSGPDATVVLRLDDGAIHARVGPFEGDVLCRQLESETDLIGLRRLLETVASAYRVVARGEREWVELTKQTGPH